MVAARAPRAVFAAAAQLSREGVEQVGVQRPDLELADQLPDVLARVPAVGLQRRRGERRHLEVPVEQLADRPAHPGVAPLVDRVEQTGPNSLGLGRGFRADRDDLDQVVAAAARRVVAA